MKLTDRAIRGIKPADKDQFIADGGGLYMRVTKTGAKTFVRRYQTDGKSRWQTLGAYPELSLADARRAAVTATPRSDKTFSDVWGEYQRRILPSYASRDTIAARISNDILPSIGDIPISEVTRAAVADALQKVVDRGRPVQANRLLADVKHVMAYAEERGWIDNNPLTKLTRKVVGGKETSRDRTLTLDELAEFLGRLRTANVHLGTKIALGLVALTGQRSSEVLSLMEGEFAGQWWTIPAEHTKPKRAQKVYLNRTAAALVRIARRYLPMLANDHRVLSHALRRMNYDFTPHDLRRTMATRMADLGVAPHVIEKCLNHQMEGVMAVYNRAEYLDERRAAWALWGATVKSEITKRRKQ